MPKIKRNCLVCNKEFYGWNCYNNKFCSKKCYWQNLIGKKSYLKGKKRPEISGSKNGNWKNKIQLNCLFCDKIFNVNPSRKNAKFCCYKCKSNYQKDKNIGRKKNGIFKLCLYCGKEFYTPKKLSERIECCSISCGRKLYYKSHKIWNYIHGKGGEHRKYGIYWDSHRIKILERDKRICKNCGKFGNDVDHIIPFRKSHDNSLENLQILCKKCHAKKTNWEVKFYG